MNSPCRTGDLFKRGLNQLHSRLEVAGRSFQVSAVGGGSSCARRWLPTGAPGQVLGTRTEIASSGLAQIGDLLARVPADPRRSMLIERRSRKDTGTEVTVAAYSQTHGVVLFS